NVTGAGTARFGGSATPAAGNIIEATVASGGQVNIIAQVNSTTGADGMLSQTSDNNNTVSLFANEPSRTFTAWGLTIGNWVTLAIDGANNNGLALGTISNKPIVFGTNNAERARLSNAGGFSVGTTTDPGAGFVLASKALQSAVLTVGTLPTCNAGSEGSRAYVSGQNTAVAYRGATSGGGTTRQAVLCSNSAWIQD